MFKMYANNRLFQSVLLALLIVATSGCVNGQSPTEQSTTKAVQQRLNTQEELKVQQGSKMQQGAKIQKIRKPDFSKPQQFSFLMAPNSAVNPIPAADTFLVKTATDYNDEQGYGFDLNTRINNKGRPFYFSVQVPEGNYRVTLEFGHDALASSNTIKAESRRLYLQNINTEPGEFVTRSFIVNVRTADLTPPETHAPGGVRVVLNSREKNSLHWDNKLTLEFNGSAPQARSVTLEKVTVPTIFLVGDSTVTDQPFEPAASWGQMLPHFFTSGYFDSEIAIANHAESGETMKSFIAELRLAKVLETMKAGDYLFIQFGHNDQKKQWPQTYVEAETTYKDYLKIFIAEARLRGATPVLITSMQRRVFNDDGKIVNTHGKYPQAVRELAAEMKLTLIDLEQMSVKLYEALGVKNAPRAFNDNGKDATHHNNYGAYQLAKCVVQAIRSSQLPLASDFTRKLANYDPSQPDPLNSFNLLPSPQLSTIRPAGIRPAGN